MSDFDWEKESHPIEAFDWEKESHPVTPVAPTRNPPRVGPGETYVNSWGEMLPAGRTALNAVGTGELQLMKLFGAGRSPIHFTEDQKQRMQAAGLWQPEFEQSSIQGPLDTFRDVRDMRRERIPAGSEQNPIADALGKGTGFAHMLLSGRILPTAASRAAPTAGKFMQALGRIGAAAETGGAYGTAYALDHGNADLTRGEFGKAAQDIAGTEGWRQAVDDYTKKNYGHAVLDVLGAGAPGGFLGGAATGATVEALRNTPGLVSGVRNFANARAVKATEPDLARYRMLQKQERLSDLGRDLLDTGVVSPFASTENIADRAAALRDQRGANIAQFLDTADNASHVEQRDYPIMAAKHGYVSEPITVQKHVGWDMTPETQATRYGNAEDFMLPADKYAGTALAPDKLIQPGRFEEQVIVPKAITKDVTEYVTKPATLGYEPQVASERWVKQGFNAEEAARNIENELMPKYANKMGRSQLASTIKRELTNLRADDPRTFQDANAVKGGLSDAINWTSQSDIGKNAVLKEIRGAFNREMERQAEQMLSASGAPAELMPKYLEDKRLYGNMATTADSAEDALLRHQRNRFFSPSDHGVGLASAVATSNPLTAVPMAAGNKIARGYGSAFTASTAHGLANALESAQASPSVARYAAMATAPRPTFDDFLLQLAQSEDEKKRMNAGALADALRRGR